MLCTQTPGAVLLWRYAQLYADEARGEVLVCSTGCGNKRQEFACG